MAHPHVPENEKTEKCKSSRGDIDIGTLYTFFTFRRGRRGSAIALRGLVRAVRDYSTDFRSRHMSGKKIESSQSARARFRSPLTGPARMRCAIRRCR